MGWRRNPKNGYARRSFEGVIDDLPDSVQPTRTLAALRVGINLQHRSTLDHKQR